MDVAFEFLLPRETKMSSIKFERFIFKWKGEEFSQNKEEALFKQFKLTKSDAPKHILSLLPAVFQKEQWQCISIIDGIDDLINELSEDGNIPPKNNALMNLLDSLIGNEKKWVVIFEPDYDCINEVLEGNIDIAFYKIVDSLTIKKNGFVMWFQNPTGAGTL